MKITVPWAFTLVFVVLKLTGFIAWSWFWVTVPLWGLLAVFGMLGAVGSFARYMWKRTNPVDYALWEMSETIKAHNKSLRR